MKTVVIALLLALTVAGYSHAAQEREDSRDRDRKEQRSKEGEWRDLKEPGKGWTLLTRQEVNFRDDRDRINVGDVGRHEGKFKELQIRVDGAPVEIRRMTVTLDDGEKFEAINKRHRFDENSRTLVIDLPGGKRRDIRSIDIDYFSVRNQDKKGKGTLMVYAR